MFSFFGRKSANRQVVSSLYHDIAKASLRPAFFSDLAVADTLEGRFEILALHMALVLRRMRGWPEPAEEVAGDLVDYYFEQLDDVLRELGTSDNKVPKKMKEMAAAYLQRAQGYDAALAGKDDEAMQELLKERFGAQSDAASLSHYVFAADKLLNDSCLDVFLEGGIVFPEPVKSGGEVL